MSQDDTDYRIEHDTMGEVRVPASALYGAQTQRAVENFPISGSGLESTRIAALARDLAWPVIVLLWVLVAASILMEMGLGVIGLG